MADQRVIRIRVEDRRTDGDPQPRVITLTRIQGESRDDAATEHHIPVRNVTALTAVEQFRREHLWRGRNDGPALLFDWYLDGKLSDTDLRYVLTDVWTEAEWPERCLGTRQWVHLFRTAGFLSDAGESAPIGPVVVYRGTTWTRRRGMAWTTDLERARWFANRWNEWGTGEGLVFRATVEPDAVLASIDDGRKQSEVVVDPAGLPPLRKSSIC